MAETTTAAAVKRQISELGGAFMLSREVKAFGSSIGVPGFHGPYTRGRGGVLGEVDADVVTAAFGFFAPDRVRSAWESTPIAAAEGAQRYLHACQEFGRRKLASFDDADRLAELLGRVANAASPAGLALFAGWRALPLPADGRARVAQLAHVVRELRGGLHFIAVTAHGLTPLEAILVSGSPVLDGGDQARLLGWPEPFAAPTAAQRERWQAAEELTDKLIQPYFEVLDEAERQELTTLLTAAHHAAFAR
ncbi:hypothetical protein F5X71_19315 [Nocardia brasiliensis]|uniref:EvbL n=1 Tax=Nocardia brasiliensis TaxID=37326 RepID=A0A6G9XTN5_NOCBR|nr:hypothetical protein [Nocardia brasiliensis]QIS04193.1 hypothetical protein F5X71_19315 [Nocardia brasiliensis]